jgi:hypothetical protein
MRPRKPSAAFVALRYLSAGMFQPPPRMLEEVQSWVQTQWANRVWGHALKSIAVLEEKIASAEKWQDRNPELAEKSIRTAREGIEALEQIIGWAKPHATRPNQGKGANTKKFKLDLRGWKYISEVGRVLKLTPAQSAEMKDQLADMTPGILSKMGWDGITAKFYVGRHKGRGGMWDRSKRLLEVLGRVPTPRTRWSKADFEERLWKRGQIVRHELQHMSQDLLGLITGAMREWRSDFGQEVRPQTGLAPPHVQNPEWKNPSTFKGLPTSTGVSPLDHGLSEVEFVTDLNDSVDLFERVVEDVPQRDRRRFLQNWLEGDSPGRSRNELQFFQLLHQRDKARWKEAVKRFVAEIKRRGIKI